MAKSNNNNGKITMVTLVCPKWGYEQTLSIEHAERLLSMENNGGWVLPENTQFNYVDGSLVRRNKKED